MIGENLLGDTAPVHGYLLLPGRYPFTFDQIATRWAFNPHRQGLLDGFKRYVDEMRSVLPVCAVWVSGSYLTSKATPGDIDATLVVSATDIENLQGSDKLLVTPLGLALLRQRLNVSVDAYILPWRCVPQPDPNRDQDHRKYYVARGYWDDWWMRLRSSTPSEGDLPRRGYVEVIVDGYPA